MLRVFGRKLSSLGHTFLEEMEELDQNIFQRHTVQVVWKFTWRYHASSSPKMGTSVKYLEYRILESIVLRVRAL